VNWLTSLWDNTFWPSLNGNGPEALAQTLVYGLIAIALIPPIRRAIERFTKRHVDSIKAHVTAEHKLVHDKLDHVIKHSKDIPDYKPPTT
jgi:hypothetical protein